ncbi:MAG: cyanophycinase [Acetivibrionales bacterium]
MEEKVRGNLVIIGGAEDKKGESIILRKVAEIAGGSNARLVILTTATEQPESVGEEYRNTFTRLGINSIKLLNINSRYDANSESAANLIREATGIFFTGGDQLRITSILGGTKVYKALQEAYSNGVVIIGTSAGASVMSSNMIVNGNSNDPARKCTLKMAPGMGLLEEAIIDQHFHQRGRIGRLLCGVAENPNILGIGIDEDTAIQVFPDAHFEVLGTNAVTVIDGRSISKSNVSELKPDEILAISGVTLHVLPTGYGFDMKDRKVLC